MLQMPKKKRQKQDFLCFYRLGKKNRNTLIGLKVGTRILLTPPSLTFIFKHKFDRVCGVVLLTFLDWTHCVAKPINVSPTRFTSAEEEIRCYF